MSKTDPENEDHLFYNNWIPIHELPVAEKTEFIGLESEYLYVRLSSVVVMTILGGLPLTIFTVLSSFPLNQKILIILGFILTMGLWALLVSLEFRHRGYAVRNQDVAYRSGFVFRRRQYMPFRRVQHCKITEGLFERLFNFSTVIVSAAGDDIVIHGLRPEEAQNLQQFINEKVDALTKEMHYGRR